MGKRAAKAAATDPPVGEGLSVIEWVATLIPALGVTLRAWQQAGVPIEELLRRLTLIQDRYNQIEGEEQPIPDELIMGEIRKVLNEAHITGMVSVAAGELKALLATRKSIVKHNRASLA